MHTISDSPLGQFFPHQGHVDLKLPNDPQSGAGRLAATVVVAVLRRGVGGRREIIRSAVLKFAPDVMLVDHMPYGAMGELVPTLEALKGSGTRSSWVCATSWTRRRWFGSGGIWRARSRRSSSTSTTCWSTDPRTSSTCQRSTTCREAAGHRLRYCGYVCSPYTLSPAADKVRKRHLRNAEDSDLIVAMAGGGADADGLFATLMALSRPSTLSGRARQ